jgi:hypothetical protein
MYVIKPDKGYKRLTNTTAKVVFISDDSLSVLIYYFPKLKYLAEGSIYTEYEFNKEYILYRIISWNFGGSLLNGGSYDDNKPIIYKMPYLGETLLSIVNDDEEKMVWVITILREQLPRELRRFKQLGFIHTDIALRNITIMDGTIHLIDYDSITKYPNKVDIDIFDELTCDFDYIHSGKYETMGASLIKYLFTVLQSL